MESIAWMAWTLPTAIFFVALACTLAVMTWLAAVYPDAERVGVLRIPTTRGDRLFVSMVLTAVIHRDLARVTAENILHRPGQARAFGSILQNHVVEFVQLRMLGLDFHQPRFHLCPILQPPAGDR